MGLAVRGLLQGRLKSVPDMRTDVERLMHRKYVFFVYG
jgi:hypothetical protein